MARHFKKVVGVDISPTMIELAKNIIKQAIHVSTRFVRALIDLLITSSILSFQCWYCSISSRYIRRNILRNLSDC